MSTLRDDLIKLAHDNPGRIRNALLPILKKASSGDLPSKLKDALQKAKAKSRSDKPFDLGVFAGVSFAWQIAIGKTAGSNDPHEQARTLIEDQRGFFRELDKHLADIRKGFQDAEKQLIGLDRVGSGTIEAPAVLKANIYHHIADMADWANQVRDYTKGILNKTNQRVG